MRFLLDTNIIVSGLLTKRGPPGMLLNAWLLDYRFDLVTSREQIDELRRALGYEHLHSRIDPAQAHDVLANLDVCAIIATNLPTLDVSPDPDDNVILATVAGRADAVVSGDRKDVLELAEVEGIPIITAQQALERLGVG